MRPEAEAPLRCCIRVSGCIGERWERWLDGMAISPADAAGETLLTGSVVDQAALLGLLQKLHNLGLVLLALRVDLGGPNAAGPHSGEQEHTYEREQGDTQD